MPVAELHFFHADDPNGSTIFECTTDDQFLKELAFDIQRDSLGKGEVSFARKVPAGGLFSRDIVVPETLVRILVPSIDATHYLFGFFINPRQQQVVSKDEQGGEGFTFAGPGPKHYLTRMVLWSASFDGRDAAVERDSHVWTWPSTARAGAILHGLLDEAAANPHVNFLPDLTTSFGSVNDSGGVPWADDISGTEDFTLKIGDDYLKILWQLEDASNIVTNMNLGTVSNPLLQLDAYQTFGRDLTDDVLFTEGVNIATDLDVEGSSYQKATHALVRGDEGVYELAFHPVPGDYPKVVSTAYQSSNNATLDRAGVRYLRRQDNGERGIELRIVPGFDPGSGLYMPSPEAFGDGDFWVGDTISLTTGISPNQTELDYDDEPQAVTGIEMELEEAVRDDTDEDAARSWKVTVHLNEERKSSNTTVDLAGNRGSVQSNPPVIKLCRVATEGTEEVLRVYPQFGNGAINPAEDSIWDGSTGFTTAKETDNAPDAALSLTLSATGGGGSSNFDQMLRQEVYPVDASLAAALVAGGMVYRGQCIVRARSGIGVSESAQDLIGQTVIRVFNSGGTLRGTVLAGHNLLTSAGSTKWHAHLVGQNRIFPPAAANDVLSALSGCVAGDFLVIEWGYRNLTVPAISGGSLLLNGDAAADLPEDELSQDRLNTWHQLTIAGAGATTGDLPLDTVRQGEETPGDSARVSRCDHQHAHGLLDPTSTNYHSLVHLSNYIFHGATAPTVSDDETDGYVVGTHWIANDDGTLWFLTDPTAGAAVWKQLGISPFSGEFEDLTTVETDTDLVAHPDGAGGVEWGPDATGGGGTGYDEGTSFPGSPSTNDKFYRTDRNLLYFYNGTLWLTVTEYEHQFDILGTAGITADNGGVYQMPILADASIFLTKFFAVTYVSTTAIWLVELYRVAAASLAETLMTSLSTSGDTAATATRHETNIDAVLPNGVFLLRIAFNETTGSATFTGSVTLRYRRVG